MSRLKRLSKLRQYSKDQDVIEYLYSQHRQNLVAIESAFSGVISNSSFYMQINPLIVATDKEITVTYLDKIKIDDGGSESNGTVSIKDNITYDTSLSFRDVFMTGNKTAALNIYVDGKLLKSHSILETTSASSFAFPAMFNFPLQLNKGSKLLFTVSNEGGTGSVVIGSGLLKMDKLII
jgi:hypothetical protein